jgi:SAM-dependent methyltransferase
VIPTREAVIARVATLTPHTIYAVRVFKRLQRLPDAAAADVLMGVREAPIADTSVQYPHWYLQRWHFLPSGYLSPRSVAAYDSGIRRLYFVLAEVSVHQRIVDALAPLRPGALLEIGCGPGHGLNALREAFPAARLTGIDLSPFMLERAGGRLRGHPVNLAHANAVSLPFPDASFDAITSTHVAGHIPVDEGRRMFREAARVLRPGGLFVTAEHRWHHLPVSGFRPAGRHLAAFGTIAITSYMRSAEEPRAGAGKPLPQVQGAQGRKHG